MAGRTPREAVEAFLAPLQQAASCLGTCKLTLGPRNPTLRIGDILTWTLNGGTGLALRGAGGPMHFHAAMTWQVIEDSREDYGPFRVTTKGYAYSLLDAAERELWAFHWHPNGPSSEQKPHLHLGSVMLADASPISNKAHLPTGRITFENAIRWVFQSGAEPAHNDWHARLALAEAPHLLYRSWGVDPQGA